MYVRCKYVNSLLVRLVAAYWGEIRLTSFITQFTESSRWNFFSLLFNQEYTWVKMQKGKVKTILHQFNGFQNYVEYLNSFV